MQSLTQGQILNNRYRIVKLIGQGGFGAVYRAWDLTLKQPVALKENLDTSPEAQRQFEREATLVAGLRHPNLPRVMDHFFLPGQGQYLVMDFVEGSSVAELLAARGHPFSEAEALPWLQQVCAALDYLHSRQPPVVHRDIKPENIIITPEGQAMLVDFGISKVYDAQLATTVGARAVTPGYSPPEQYGAGKTDARTDIYALGATLYRLLTGEEPPPSVDMIAGVAELKPPRQLNGRLSQATEQAILQAMSVNISQRFDHVTDFLDALQNAPQPALASNRNDSEPTQVLPATAVANSSIRNPLPGWVWGVGVLLILTVALGLGFALRESRNNDDGMIVVANIATPTLAVTIVPEPQPPDRWEYGFVINDVIDDTPAKTSGFETGDIIIAVDNTPISPSSTLFDLIQSRFPGDEARFWVVRHPNVTPFSISVVLADHPDFPGRGYLGISGDNDYFLERVAIVNTPTPTPIPSPTPTPPPISGHIVFVSDRNSNEDIYLVSSDGRQPPTRISGSGLDYAPGWSVTTGEIVFVSKRNGRYDLFAMNTSGVNLRQLTFEGISAPLLSPDGSMVAFRSDRGLSWISVLTGDITRSSSNISAVDYTWSPDARQLATIRENYSQTNDNYEIMLQIFNADEPDNFTTTTLGECSGWNCARDITWSADGEWLALTLKLAHEDYKIYKVRPDGSELTLVVDMPEAELEFPVWSPNSRQILFVATTDTRGNNVINNCDNSAIYRVSASGGGTPVRLTDTSVESYWPVWSPDGTRIAYVVLENGSNEIYVMDSQGNNKTRLTRPEANADAYYPSWSADGSQILFASSQYAPRLYQLDVVTGQQIQIATDANSVIHKSVHLTHDGRKLAFTREFIFSSKRKALLGGNTHICSSEELVTLANPLMHRGNEVPDTDPFPLTRSLRNWSSNGRDLLFIGWNEGLYTWNDQTESARQLDVPDSAYYYGSSLSPDGSRVAYVDSNSNELLLISTTSNSRSHIAGEVYVYNDILFSPDGQMILFVSGPSFRERRLQITDIQGRLLHQIAFNSGTLEDYIWLPNGRGIVYELWVGPQSYLWLYNLEHETSTLIGELPYDIWGLTVSPDSLWLAFTTSYTGNREIYAMPVGGGEVINLTNHPANESNPVWVP